MGPKSNQKIRKAAMNMMMSGKRKRKKIMMLANHRLPFTKMKALVTC